MIKFSLQVEWYYSSLKYKQKRSHFCLSKI